MSGSGERLGFFERIFGSKRLRELVEDLRHPDAEVRANAANRLRALGWNPRRAEDRAWFAAARGDWTECASIGDPAVDALTAGLLDDSVRTAVADALGSEEARPGLEALVKRACEQYWSESQPSTEAVVRLGDIAAQPLAQALERYWTTLARWYGDDSEGLRLVDWVEANFLKDAAAELLARIGRGAEAQLAELVECPACALVAGELLARIAGPRAGDKVLKAFACVRRRYAAQFAPAEATWREVLLRFVMRWVRSEDLGMREEERHDLWCPCLELPHLGRLAGVLADLGYTQAAPEIADFVATDPLLRLDPSELDEIAARWQLGAGVALALLRDHSSALAATIDALVRLSDRGALARALDSLSPLQSRAGCSRIAAEYYCSGALHESVNRARGVLGRRPELDSHD